MPGDTREGDRQDQRKRSTRERILEAAAGVFAEKGYHAAAVDDIVRASGTSKGSVYFHFPTKQAVFLSLIDRYAGRLEEAVQEAIAREAGAVAKVEAALRTLIQFLGEHRRLAKIVLVHGVGLGGTFDQQMLAVRRRFAQLIQAHLERAAAEGDIPAIDAPLAARVWLGAVNELVVGWLLEDEPPVLEAVLPELSRLLLASIGIRREAGAADGRKASGGNDPCES